MAVTGGPTVTLTFKGDTTDLRREVAAIGTMVAGVGATVGILGGIGAAAGATVLAVAAIPAAFLGIGIAAAAQSEAVKARFTEMKDHVVASVTALARPIEAELLRSADSIQAAYDRIAPSLGRIFEMAAPHLAIFTDGLIALIENAMPGFETAIRNSTPIVEAFGRGLGMLGTGIGGFFAALSEGAPGATVALDALFGLVQDLLIYLGQLVAQLANALGPAFAAMTGPIMGVVRALGDALMPVIIALAPLLGPLAELLGTVLTIALGALSTALTPVVQALVNALQPVIPVITAAFERMSPVIMDIAEKMGVSLAEAVVALAPLLLSLVEESLRLVEALLPLIPPLIEIGRNAMPLVAGFTRDVLIPVLRWLVDMLVKYVIPTMAQWLDEMARVSGGMREAWDVIKTATTEGIGAVKLTTTDGGRSIMQGFLDGVVAMTGPVGIGVKTALDTVRALFPSSPAKEGPFSGLGYTYHSGVAMMEDFAKGIQAAAPALYEKMASVVGDMQGMIAAAGEVARHITSGGAIFEDLSFRGMSANLAKYNDQLSKMFSVGRSAGGALELKIAPGADSALSSMLMNLVRTGQLQLAKV